MVIYHTRPWMYTDDLPEGESHFCKDLHVRIITLKAKAFALLLLTFLHTQYNYYWCFEGMLSFSYQREILVYYREFAARTTKESFGVSAFCIPKDAWKVVGHLFMSLWGMHREKQRWDIFKSFLFSVDSNLISSKIFHLPTLQLFLFLKRPRWASPGNQPKRSHNTEKRANDSSCHSVS